MIFSPKRTRSLSTFGVVALALIGTFARGGLTGCSECDDGGACKCTDSAGNFVGSGSTVCFDDGSAECDCSALSGTSGATSATVTSASSGASTSTGGPSAPTDGEPCEEDGLLECGVADADGESNDALFCSSGTWKSVFECPATQSCGDIVGLTTISCGSDGFRISYAIEGAPCSSEQAAACTFDQNAQLTCQQGIWQVQYECSPGLERCDYLRPGETVTNSHGTFACPAGPTGCFGCR